MSNLLPHSHVLDLIQGLTKEKPKDSMSIKRAFVDKNKGKWAVIRQEHVNNGRDTINHIESIHSDINDVPFHTFSKQHILHPVSDLMASHGSFTGHENF